MPQMKHIRAIVFDAYGTLFDVHSIAATCERLFPGKGAALSQMWRTKQLEYTWLRNSMTMQAHVDFNVVTQDALRVCCEALKLPYTDAALAELNAAYRSLQPFAEVRGALQTLHEKFPLAILSNGAPDMLNALVKHNGFDPFLHYVLSVEEAGAGAGVGAGVFKPDPRVYQLAVDRLRLGMARGKNEIANTEIANKEIAFVSSNGWDAAGAKSFGFTVFWINRASAPIERLGAGIAPDYIVTGLDDVVAMM